MTDLTPAQKEAFARADGSTVNLWALEFRHPSFTAPIRIVQSRVDIDLTLEASAPIDAGASQTFTAAGFQIKAPDVDSEPDSIMNAQVDGVSGEIHPLIQAASKTSIPVEMTAREFVYNVRTATVTTMLQNIYLQFRGSATDKQTIVMRFGYTNSANKAFPNKIYTPESNRGLL